MARQDLFELVSIFTQKSKRDLGDSPTDIWEKGVVGKRPK